MNNTQIALFALVALCALSFAPADAQWTYYYYPSYANYGYGYNNGYNYYYPSYNYGYNSYYYPSYGYYYGKRSAGFGDAPQLQQAPVAPQQNPQQ
ncbi:hypothetical protein L596_028534 [Steinernema carpocapsae]|nr:hypothetical protein L596_028534 [Steinernema carpocapsae]